MAMVEPFISHRINGRVRNDLSPEAVIASIAVASGLGNTSAYTWLKVPVRRRHGAGHGRVDAARAAPAAARSAPDQDAVFGRWRKALELPSVRGLVVGRSLLFPPDDDVAGAVDTPSVELQ